jgi:hypothetical protein
MNTELFIGLSKKGAQDLAEAKGLIFRLVSIDNEAYLGYPEDTRTDRVCCEITSSKVSKATIQ